LAFRSWLSPRHRFRINAASFGCQYVATGVGQLRAWRSSSDDEESVALVWSADDGSGQTVPPCSIPERGKVPEHSDEPALDELCAVFDDDPFGSGLFDESGVFSPQPRAVIIEPATASSTADALAGKTAAEDFRFDFVSADMLDILEASCRRKVPL
jgi:hypothetical protein